MKSLKRITVICVAIIFLIALLPVSAFAVDPVTFSEAETLGATIVDLYGVYNNTSLAYDQMSSSGALTEIVTLYNNYSQSASDPYTLAAIGAAAAAAGAVAVIYDAITGQGYVQLYQEQYVSSLDGYWDYQLADAGLVRDSITGFYNWITGQGDVVNPIVIYSSSPIPILPVNSSIDNSTQAQIVFNSGDVLLSRKWNDTGNNATPTIYSSFVSTDTNQNVYLFGYISGSYLELYSAFTNNSLPIIYLANYDDYWHSYNKIANSLSYTYNNSAGCYINRISYISSFTSYYDVNSGFTIYPSADDAYSALYQLFHGSGIASSSVSLEPSIFIGDPLENPLEITIPDPSSPDYNPEPRRITTTIPWNPEWGDPLPDGISTPEYGIPYPITDPSILNEAVPAIWDSIIADGVGIQDAPVPVQPGPAPSEVYIPLLPVTLPSFNFSFSGIWHYVVTWVGTLGSWLSLMFTVWQSLPYAIVVPVYATAVVVIVIGTLKRFL